MWLCQTNTLAGLLTVSVHVSIQEERKGAISRSVDLEALEKGVKNSITVVNVSLRVFK